MTTVRLSVREMRNVQNTDRDREREREREREIM